MRKMIVFVGLVVALAMGGCVPGGGGR